MAQHLGTWLFFSFSTMASVCPSISILPSAMRRASDERLVTACPHGVSVLACDGSHGVCLIQGSPASACSSSVLSSGERERERERLQLLFLILLLRTCCLLPHRLYSPQKAFILKSKLPEIEMRKTNSSLHG